MTWFRFLLLISTSALAFGCNKLPTLGPGDENVLASAAQEDCGYIINKYGQRISWKGQLPVRLLVQQDFPDKYMDVLKSAAKKWEDAAGMTLFSFEKAGSYLSNIPLRDSQNAIYWLSTWDSNQSLMQALTTVYYSNNYLLEADLKIDNRYFAFYSTEPNSRDEVHLESLLIHELGHVLGLKHKEVIPTVMFPTLSSNTVRNDLSETDKLSLKCEY